MSNQIIYNEDTNIVVIEDDLGTDIQVVETVQDGEVTVVTVIEKGDKGDQGEKGDKGDKGDPGDASGGDLSYVHTQSSPSNEWTVVHNLDKYPSVTIVDSGNNVCIGAVTYVDTNSLIVRFSVLFGGKAYLS